MMERAGKKNGKIKIGNFGNRIISQWKLRARKCLIRLRLYTSNPVAAGFATKPEDTKYRSALDFCGMKGLVELSYS